MRKFRKISALVLICVMMAGFAACGGNGGSSETTTSAAPTVTYTNDLPKDPVTLKIAFFEAGFGRAWLDYAIDSFEASFPNVTIEVEASPTIDQVITTKISAKNDEDMFDLFSTTRLVYEDYAEANLLDTVEDLFERSPYDTPDKKLKDLMNPSLYNSQRFQYRGQIFTIDFCVNVLGLYYEKALFAENGWNTQPQTYQEFEELCDAIKKKKMNPMVFYRGYQLMFMRPKMWELANEAGELKAFDDSFRNMTENQYVNPYSSGMWQKFYEMGKKKYFEAGIAAVSHMEAQMQIIQRDTAMVVSGSWIQNEMKEAVPEGFEWGFMVMPLVSDASKPIYTLIGAEDSFFIWNNKPELNKAWAKEFLLWLHNLDVQAKMAENGMISIRNDFIDDPDRYSLYQGVVKDVVSAVETDKIETVEITHRNRVLVDTKKLSNTAWSLMDEKKTFIALGKVDPLPLLQQAEDMYTKSLEEGYREPLVLD